MSSKWTAIPNVQRYQFDASREIGKILPALPPCAFFVSSLLVLTFLLLLFVCVFLSVPPSEASYTSLRDPRIPGNHRATLLPTHTHAHPHTTHTASTRSTQCAVAPSLPSPRSPAFRSAAIRIIPLPDASTRFPLKRVKPSAKIHLRKKSRFDIRLKYSRKGH